MVKITLILMGIATVFTAAILVFLAMLEDERSHYSRTEKLFKERENE